MEQVFRSGKSAIARHDLMMDGVPHHYEHWLSLLDKEYLLCMCRDVSQLWETEQTNAEQQNEIMRLNSLMEAIVNNVPVYLFVKDSGNDFRYLYWNKTFADYSGIPIEKAIGRNDFEIFKRTEDMEKFRLDDIRVLKEGKLDYFEEYMAASGEIRTITTMKRLVPSSNEHPYIIGISWDITEIKKTEKALDAARIKAEEADRLKSAFLANMSHEIRTPLNALSGFSSLLTEEGLDDETRRQCNEVIQQNSELLLKLINDVIDLSSLEFGKLQFCIAQHDAVSICKNVIDTVNKVKQTQAELTFTTELEEMPIETDDSRLQQVLINLLINATKFTPQGSIVLKLEKETDDTVLFTVTDTGCGIPKDKQANIFQRFEKLNENAQGSGLGLSICQLIIEHIGGQIWIDSEYAEGSRFCFTHPISQTGRKENKK